MAARSSLTSIRLALATPLQSALVQPLRSRSVRELHDLTRDVAEHMKRSSDMQQLWSAMQHPIDAPEATRQAAGAEPVSPAERWRRAQTRTQAQAVSQSIRSSSALVTPPSTGPTWGLGLPGSAVIISHLVALGLGSLGALRDPSSSGTNSGAGGRGPYRLFQLALALALAERLRETGSSDLQLVFSDPAYDDLDLDLISSFEGTRVLSDGRGGPLEGSSPTSLLPDLGGRKLLYMPCCPRALVIHTYVVLKPYF